MDNRSRIDLKHATVADPEVTRKRSIERYQARKHKRVADERLKNWKPLGSNDKTHS